MADIEHWTERESLDAWRYEDLGCPHCGKTCDVCLTLAEIIGSERAKLRGAVEALRAIADAPDSDAIKARIENHYSDLRILKECRNLAREALGEQ